MAVVKNEVKFLSKVVKVQTPTDLKKFKGLTLGQIQSVFMKQTYLTPKDGDFDESALLAYRKDLLKKSGGLLTLVTPTETFADLGGAARFKQWAKLVRPAFSPEGVSFGLEPPKGVLLLGVWGTGKSLSVKALAHAWGLPLLSFEMGRLRSGLVGASEGNLYRVLKTIESFGDCLVWVDEAEKSLSGSASSNATDGGVGLRMLGILSTWMQEQKSVRSCFALTANSVSTLPVEFINRIDERFFFDLPEGDDLIQVISLHLKKRGYNTDAYNLATLKTAAARLVPREIEQAIKLAAFEAYAADPKNKQPSMDILLSVLSNKVRILDTMEKQVSEVREWVGYDPTRDEGRNAKLAAGRGSKSTVQPEGFKVL